ncbi:MAG: GNAT family protein [Patescibacteria group bacterium]
MPKSKSTLPGKRIILRRLKPTLLTAKALFRVVDENRQHLSPWFPWVTSENNVEDALKYLFTVDEKFKLGEKTDYGIYLNNEYIGNIGIFDINKKNKSGEIGYWLSKKFTRNGYMTEALGVLEKESFLNLNLNRIQIKCDERNIPSAGVAKKSGYTLEGKYREDTYSEYFKDFRNTFIFSKLKSDFKKSKKRPS